MHVIQVNVSKLEHYCVASKLTLILLYCVSLYFIFCVFVYNILINVSIYMIFNI